MSMSFNPKKSRAFRDLLLKFDEVLGLDLKNYKKQADKLPEEIVDLVSKRDEARNSKNWSESDKIRNLLVEKGYRVQDTKEGTIVKKG